jgi:hypothetical protein
MKINFSMDINIHDENAFRFAAWAKALEDGLSDEDADAFRDPQKQSLTDCAIMLFDPGSGPNGCDIDGSSADQIGELP